METEKIYEDIVVAAFQKAKNEYVNNKKYRLSEYISEQVEELSKVRINLRTFVFYHEKYIEKKEGIATPRHENIEHLCLFLGYDSYKDYVNKNYNGETVLPLPKDSPKNLPIEKIITTALWIIAIMFIGFTLYNNFGIENATNECMIWVDDHYEKTICSGARLEKRLDKETLKDFKELKFLCKDDTFFLNDEPVVWYDKSKTIMTYFTALGIHPINGKTLKPITQDMIDTHVPECKTNPKKE